MRYELYSSIDEMLAPETLATLTGQPVRYVHVQPFTQHTGISGSRFLTVTTDNGHGPHFVLKRMSPASDWIMQATDDQRCRLITLWRAGALDRLRPEVEHEIIACAFDGDGWAMLMYDLTDGLLRFGHLDNSTNEAMVRSLATQHARFWQAPELQCPDLGLCDLPTLVKVTIPKGHQNDFGSARTFFSDIINKGFGLLDDVFDPDVAAILHRLVSEPQPLFDALSHYPHTLLHGDFKANNLALMPGARLHAVVFDWQMAAVGPATLDLMWYIGFGYPSPALPEECIAAYRHHLAGLLGDRFNPDQWQSLLALGILATAVRQCCHAAWVARCETSAKWQSAFQQKLPWWSDQIRAAVQWL